MVFATLITCAITITASIVGQSPQSANPPATENKASADKPPVEILSHKIGPESYPMLDRVSSMAAENGAIPRLPNQSRRNSDPNGPQRRQGRLGSSYQRVPAPPQLIQVAIKNISAKSIKVVEWDFLFPHCENGRFVPRYDVTTSIKLKTGGKKTLKRRLSPHVGRCDMPKVISIDEVMKQEPLSIKRIEYVDGSVWQKP